MVATAHHPTKSNNCQEVGGQILECWTVSSPSDDGKRPSFATPLATAMVAIGDKTLAMKFVDSELPSEFDQPAGEAFSRLADLVGWKRIELSLRTLFKRQKRSAYRSDVCGALTSYESTCCIAGKMSAALKSV